MCDCLPVGFMTKAQACENRFLPSVKLRRLKPLATPLVFPTNIRIRSSPHETAKCSAVLTGASVLMPKCSPVWGPGLASAWIRLARFTMTSDCPCVGFAFRLWACENYIPPSLKLEGLESASISRRIVFPASTNIRIWSNPNVLFCWNVIRQSTNSDF